LVGIFRGDRDHVDRWIDFDRQVAK
jgi:hypothetical protein